MRFSSFAYFALAALPSQAQWDYNRWCACHDGSDSAYGYNWELTAYTCWSNRKEYNKTIHYNWRSGRCEYFADKPGEFNMDIFGKACEYVKGKGWAPLVNGEPDDSRWRKGVQNSPMIGVCR